MLANTMRSGRIRTILGLLLTMVFLVPATSRASTMTFLVTGGELSVTFGLLPFELSEDFEQQGGIGLTGSVHLISGPLTDLDVDGINGITTYTYGPGTLEITETAGGTFTGNTSPFAIVVCEGCDSLFGGSLADDFAIDFGGSFDAAFAKLLGVRRPAGGTITFGLEAIDGGPADNARLGFDHRGFADLDLDVEEVPEPLLLTLALTSGAGWVAWRRRRP